MKKACLRFLQFIILTAIFSTNLFYIGSNAIASDQVIINSPKFVDIAGASGLVCPVGQTISGCPLSVSGLPDTATYLVALRIGNGETPTARLQIANPSGIVLSYGYFDEDLASFASISFTGTHDSITASLASLSYISNGFSGPESISIIATENVPGVAYYAKDDHFYKVGHFGNVPGFDQGVFCADPSDETAQQYIIDYSSIQSLSPDSGWINLGDNPNLKCSWNNANQIAKSSNFKGQRGYLANITSQQENQFLQSKLSGALNVWIGGSDGAADGSLSHDANNIPSFDYPAATQVPDTFTGGTEGLWRYYDGPERGKVFWRYTGFSSPATQDNWESWRSSIENYGYDPNSDPSINDSNVSKSGHDVLGFSNWCWEAYVCYEPNNSSSIFTLNSQTAQQGEDNIVFNWRSADGRWNDLNGFEPTVPFYGYIIEYGGLGSFSGVTTSEIKINPIKHSVSYDISGGSGSVPTPQQVLQGETFTAPSSNGFSLNGYSFNGWNSASDGSGDLYSQGNTYYLNSDQTLYAQWVKNPQPTQAPPDPVQQNSISETGPISGSSAGGDSVTLPGNFPAPIISIQIDSSPLPSGSWNQTPKVLTFIAPPHAPGEVAINIYDGQSPVLPPVKFTYVENPIKDVLNSQGSGESTQIGAPTLPKENLGLPTLPSSAVIIAVPEKNGSNQKRKVSISSKKATAVIQIAPPPATSKLMIDVASSDIVIRGLNEGQYIKVTIAGINGESQVVSPSGSSELNSIIQNNEKSKLKIEITPTLGSALQRSAQIAIAGAKKSQHVRVTVK